MKESGWINKKGIISRDMLLFTWYSVPCYVYTLLNLVSLIFWHFYVNNTRAVLSSLAGIWMLGFWTQSINNGIKTKNSKRLWKVFFSIVFSVFFSYALSCGFVYESSFKQSIFPFESDQTNSTRKIFEECPWLRYDNNNNNIESNTYMFLIIPINVAEVFNNFFIA